MSEIYAFHKGQNWQNSLFHFPVSAKTLYEISAERTDFEGIWIKINFKKYIYIHKILNSKTTIFLIIRKYTTVDGEKQIINSVNTISVLRLRWVK